MKRELIVFPDDLAFDRIDRIADAGIDVLGIHSPGGVKAADHLADMMAAMETADFRARIDHAHARGLSVEYEMHAAGYLMPRSLFAEHPDWFRMNAAGERSADWNFCVSNPDALAYFAKNAVKLARALYGSTHDFYFWMDDGYDIFCHCPKCRGLSASDQQLIAVNAMTEAIRREIPDARVAYLAYVESIIPPTQVKPADGVFLEYAPFEKYTAPKTEEGAARIEQEAKMLVPLLDFFGRKDAKVLEYWYDNSMLSRWTKPPKKFVLDYEAMERDMAYYRDLGFSYQATFGCYLGDEYEALYNEIVDFGPFGRCLK